MLVDSTMLARVTAEVSQWAVGAPIRRVIQPRQDMLALEIGRSGEWRCLVIDWSAGFSRLHLARDMPSPSRKEHRMGAVLRRYLSGARLAAAAQQSFDRLVHLRFTNCDRLGPQSRCTLIAELMGRRSNLVLTDESNIIIEAGKHVTEGVNRYRQTVPRLQYVPPPDFGRISLAEANAQLLSLRAEDAGEKELRGWLRANFHGCSDLFLAEVCARSELDGHCPLTGLAPGWQERLATVLRRIPQQTGALSEAYLYYDVDGERPELAYPLELVCMADRRRERASSLSGALEQLQGELAAARGISELRDRLLSAVRHALAKADRVVMHREKAVRRGRDADLDRRRGEAILAHLHELSAGQSEITVSSFDEEGGELTIALDPSLSPVENAQRHFQRYRKASRLKQVAPRLLALARHNLEYLRQVQTQIDIAETQEDLQGIEEELIAQAYLRSRPQARARRHTPRRPRSTQTTDGYVILYGKSGTENDAVLQAAQPDDWWFHVKGAPGAHAVLRTDSRPEQVPETSLEQAAHLAAMLSARRTEGKVQVDYMLAKHVTKPRGGRPGLAYYTAARTIVVDLSQQHSLSRHR